MHRKYPGIKRIAVASLGLLALGLAFLGYVQAQDGRTQSLVVPVGRTITVKTSSNKPISKTELKGDTVATASIDKGDLKTALITGRGPGVEQLVLTDSDGRKDTFEVVVQTDVEYLKFIMRKVAPTAAIEPVPAGSNAYVLTGTVAKAEDIPILIATAQTVTGGAITNALRVGGVQQVQLDIMIARVNRSEARQMGFSWVLAGNRYFITSTVGGSGASASSLTTGLASTASALGGNPNMIVGILGDPNSFLGFLNALRTEGLAKLMAAPSVTTLSGQPAEFVSGGDQAVPVIAAGGAGGAVSGVQFIPFGTTVRFLPIVMGNGKIYLDVEPSFTFPDPNPLFAAPVSGSSGQVFGRVTQRVQTKVIIEDGQTFAIGGLIQRKQDAAATKVPLLGDLPFLGTFFRTINYQENEEELLILVTPHLVDPLDCRQLPKYLPGQETRSPSDFELWLEGLLEAPRGPREVFPGGHYRPAYMNAPNAGSIPCGDATGSCGVGLRAPGTFGDYSTGTSVQSAVGVVPGAMPSLTPPPATMPLATPTRMPAGTASISRSAPVTQLPAFSQPLSLPEPPPPAVAPPLPVAQVPAAVVPPPILPEGGSRPVATLQAPTELEQR